MADRKMRRERRASSPVEEIETGAPTANAAVRNYVPHKSGTRAYSIEVAWLRDTATLLNKDVRSLHQESQRDVLDERAYLKARKTVPALLEELGADRGMGWSDIAELVGVSVSAIRKWRKGGDSSPANRFELARLAAMLDFLSEFAIGDPAQWLEIPFVLPGGIEVRPYELYRDGNVSALLEVASGRTPITAVLDEIEPSWREERRTEYEVFAAEDGQRGIRFRSEP
ncbi:helix-turn-helix domain-containing protein [Kribbella sp. NPDC020789]